MRIHYAVDERNDPLRAAEAAAKLFTLNYQMLGQWSLAITGYNHGPAGVQRGVKKFNTNDIVELVDERNGRFGFASANFYACFLAALEVEQNAGQYFPNQALWDMPDKTQKVTLTRPLNKTLLLKWFDGNIEKAKEANAHLQKPFWLGYASLSAKDFVRVPEGQLQAATEDLQKTNHVNIARTATSTEEGDHNLNFYLIGQGETLSEIAAQLGVSVRTLTELNGIENPRGLRAGQKILIPKSK